MTTACVVMAMHGAPPNDFPPAELAEFFRLHMQVESRDRPPDSTLLARHAELDARVRAWPRTAQNDPFHSASQQLAGQLQEIVGHPVLVGFNEFCAPGLEEALEQAVGTAAALVLVITPMMTRGGGHAEVEIPEAIERAQQRHPLVRFVYAWPFDNVDIANFLAHQVARFLPPLPTKSLSKTAELQLQTRRLRLIPLDEENLKLSLEDPGRMEANLGLQVTEHGPEGHVRQAVECMLEHVQNDRPNWLWYTNWQIVLRGENRIVGGFCFKGPASDEGEVDVGYGIEPQDQNQGYMTEALQEVARWAFQQPGVRVILAETELGNAASQAVLEKVGFVPFRETESAQWWRLSPAGRHNPEKQEL